MKLFVKVVAVIIPLFLVSCERLDPEDSYAEIDWEIVTRPDANVFVFYSEEELSEYFQNEYDGMQRDNQSSWREALWLPTHYYRLKTSPPDTVIRQINLDWDVWVTYAPKECRFYDYDFIIRYYPFSSYDIETYGVWPKRPSPRTSYIREIGGITYYIARWDDIWRVEWVNEDEFNMRAIFPYLRFTADEVLAYVSDLERVEIVG